MPAQRSKSTYHTVRVLRHPPVDHLSPAKIIEIAMRHHEEKRIVVRKNKPMNSNPHIKHSTSESFSPSLLGTSADIHLRYILCPAPLIPLYQVPSSPFPAAPLEKRGTRGRIPQETQGSTRVCLHRIAHGKTGIEGCRDIGCCWCAAAAAWCTVIQWTTGPPPPHQKAGLFVTPYRTYQALTSPLLSLSYLSPIQSLPYIDISPVVSLLSLLPTTQQTPSSPQTQHISQTPSKQLPDKLAARATAE